MSDELVKRLRADGGALCDEAAAVIEHLRAVVTTLETELTMTAGTMRKLHEERIREDTFRVTHDVPPSTPRE